MHIINDFFFSSLYPELSGHPHPSCCLVCMQGLWQQVCGRLAQLWLHHTGYHPRKDPPPCQVRWKVSNFFVLSPLASDFELCYFYVRYLHTLPPFSFFKLKTNNCTVNSQANNSCILRTQWFVRSRWFAKLTFSKNPKSCAVVLCQNFPLQVWHCPVLFNARITLLCNGIDASCAARSSTSANVKTHILW